VNSYIQAAKNKNVKAHIVLGAGINRAVFIYREAKEEDVRNCQWYNENKLASDTQILDPDAMNTYIWSTLSRYSRKMHANLEAKAKAALAFLKQRMDEEPDVLFVLSGWAESELNFNRINQSKNIQDYFCDYSPFAVLEFRDWIQHSGMYDDAAGEYKGQGYAQGGAKYQGTSGLTQFNQDFGTSFSKWDLKYYNWNLTDDYDTDPTDSVNNDPHRIPYSSYSHGNMMPTSGANYIAGGFDPPRVMDPGNDYWDLWNLFRETMVHHSVKDMAKWAAEARIAQNKWFSHQIPADYLFGTNPDMYPLDGRYYTDFSGEHDKSTGENTLQISGKIWSGHSWKWKNWGDFSHFEIYRGEAHGFPLDGQHLLAETDTYAYTDLTARKNTTYYYRIRAVNSKGNPGAASLPLKLPKDVVYILNLKVEEGGTTDPEPGLYGLDSGVEVEITAFPDEMHFFSGWSGSESGNESPLTVLMDRDKTITAHFSETNLYPPLNFRGQKIANRSLVQVEYINNLTWEANPLNQNLNTYRIYELRAEIPQLLAELGPTVFQYAHRSVERDKEYTYQISVVDSLGHEGPPATIKVI